MNSRNSTIILIVLVLISLLGLFALYSLNQYLIDRFSYGETFLTYWVGNRSLILDGDSPYSRVVNTQVQELAPDEPDCLRVEDPAPPYPIYLGLIIFPFALISSPATAQVVWMLALEVAILAAVVVSLRMMRWQTRIWLLPLCFLFVIFWFHPLYSLLQADAILITTLLIVLAISAVRSGLDEVAGILFALSTITPAAVILLLVFVFIWSVFQQRWRIIFWLLGMLLLLILSGVFFVPSWPVQYFQDFAAATDQFTKWMPAAAFQIWSPGIGTRLGWVFLVFLGLVLLVEWWLAWNRPDESQFIWTASLTLAVSRLIGFDVSLTNVVLLLFPILLIFNVISERWKMGGRFAVVFAWLVLLVGPWWLFMRFIQDQFTQSDVFVLLGFTSSLTILFLYWIRWWAIRPKRLLIDELRSRGL